MKRGLRIKIRRLLASIDASTDEAFNSLAGNKSAASFEDCLEDIVNDGTDALDLIRKANEEADRAACK